MALQHHDLAILSARVGVARVGASRVGFCPEDVEGINDEPGEYIWKEDFPPTTLWTLDSVFSFCAERPVAAFTDVPDPSDVNADVQFTDESTPQEVITFWLWDFGDGETSNEQNPVHAYAASGVYTVTLYVAGPRGSASTTGEHTVVDPEPAPVAHFSWTSDAETEVLRVDATASTGTIDTYAWDYGDSIGTGSGDTDVYDYGGMWPNNYTVTLTVTGPGGSDQVDTVITTGDQVGGSV